MSVISKEDFSSSSSKKTRDVESLEVSTDSSKNSKLTEISCESGKCSVNIDNETSEKGSKLATDVRVKVYTDMGNKNKKKQPDSEEDDVPVIMGMNGVNPEDMKNKNENQASEILTVPGTDELIVINEKPKENPKEPVPPNWHRVPSWKQRPSSFYPDSNEIPKRPPNCKPEDEVEFHLYNVGKLPQGWSSSWKPSYPRFPEDRYHYKTNNGHEGYDVQFVTQCSCSRTPVYRPKPFVPPTKPSYPWYPPVETTTKIRLDGKLLPPFDKAEKRRI